MKENEFKKCGLSDDGLQKSAMRGYNNERKENTGYENRTEP